MHERTDGTQRDAAGGRGAFTLLEMIVVITIIGLLGSIVAIKVEGVSESARITAAKADLKSILSAAAIVHTTTGRYPESLEELVDREDGLGLDDFPIDPWGGRYVYFLERGRPRVRCLGSDGAEGGEGIAADLELPRRGDGNELSDSVSRP